MCGLVSCESFKHLTAEAVTSCDDTAGSPEKWDPARMSPTVTSVMSAELSMLQQPDEDGLLPLHLVTPGISFISYWCSSSLLSQWSLVSWPVWGLWWMQEQGWRTGTGRAGQHSTGPSPPGHHKTHVNAKFAFLWCREEQIVATLLEHGAAPEAQDR